MQASRTGVRAAVMADIRNQYVLRRVNTSEMRDRSDPTMYFGKNFLNHLPLTLKIFKDILTVNLLGQLISYIVLNQYDCNIRYK